MSGTFTETASVYGSYDKRHERQVIHAILLEAVVQNSQICPLMLREPSFCERIYFYREFIPLTQGHIQGR